MPNRLDPINLVSFVGGLNLRRSQFQLAQDESPDLLNVDIDPRGGFMTRKGWLRWNEEDIVDVPIDAWEPRNAFSHVWSDDNHEIYVVSENSIYSAGEDGVFTTLAGVSASATPHGADFAAWGDDVYIVPGKTVAPRRRTLDGALTTLAATFSEIDTPTSNVTIPADFIESHAGYMFVGSTREGGIDFDDRIRWSHPGAPDSYRADDFIDISDGGGRITGLLSFGDHLLIFKTTSVHALYGYDEGSWQRIKISDHIGCPGTTAITRSEDTVYFYSLWDRGGIYGYAGEKPVLLSERISIAFEDLTVFENVFVSWAGRRLWVSVPWEKDGGATVEPRTTFVYNTDIGDGAWVLYQSDHCAVSIVLDGSDTNLRFPLAAMWCVDAAIFASLDHIDDAYDDLFQPGSLWATEDLGYIVTDLDQEIGVLPDSAIAFESHYRTPWLHAGWPDRKKSWRRPTFICRGIERELDLLVETYRDYDETNVHRSRTLHVEGSGGTVWSELGADDPGGEGFDWSELGVDDPSGRGMNWAAGRAGARMVRGGSLGLARSVQMKVKPAPTALGAKWGVDGIVAKYVNRRFR